MSKPVISSLINEGYNIEVIDIDENRERAQTRHITSVPTLILVEEGQRPKIHLGMLRPEQIKSALDDGGKSNTVDV
jgi:thioredoxin-like negative regulator of GroEL